MEKTHTFVIGNPYRTDRYNLIKIARLKDLLAHRNVFLEDGKNRDNLPGGLDREYEV